MTELWLLRLCHGPIWVLGCQFEGVSSCLSLGRGEGAVQGARHGAWPPGEAWLAATSHHQPRPGPGVHPHIIHGHHLLLLVFPSFPHSLSLSAGPQDAVLDCDSILRPPGLWFSLIRCHQPPARLFSSPMMDQGQMASTQASFPTCCSQPFPGLAVRSLCQWTVGHQCQSIRAGWAGQWPVWNICWGRHIQPWRMLTWLLQRRDPAGGGEKKGWRKGGSSPGPGVTGKGWAERVILCQARPGSSLFHWSNFRVRVASSLVRAAGQDSPTVGLVIKLFVLLNRHKWFFLPFALSGFSGY